MHISPIDAHDFGARVGGLDIARLQDDTTRKQLRHLLADRGLLIIHNVEPDHILQASLSEAFGFVKAYPETESVRFRGSQVPAIGKMTSSPGAATVVEFGGRRLAGWMPWHYDQCYNDKPNCARTLRCGEQPKSGGMTGFLDGRELYRHLTEPLREAIAECEIVYQHNLSVADLRYGVPAGFRLVSLPQRQSAQPPSTPRVASHPAIRYCTSGEPILHFSPWMATGIAGRPKPEGDALLDAIAHEIWQLADTLAYFHEWTPSDIIVWDNLRMLHSSTGHDPSESRTMFRSTIHAA
ncbi:taurine dioxygenase [Sphingomonas sp. SORGH_AS 950]|uniref:TauD/TfdA dioxygenase family protein n=1 Tax=Sphingomonas sp. SORGH_AS_0950 TaxID=3041792 RepID=UPI00278275F9|nr:TauD/TfdA family dioxygenase [Sphingomonas sp. SORGH_AS_0950]MDQ1159632.1 taurine dioxygenase [Sphingomonas sp. SORGH_AS_0950]